MFATDTSMLAADSWYRARARSQVSPEVIDEELQRTSADFDVSLDVLKALVFIGSRTHSASEVEVRVMFLAHSASWACMRTTGLAGTLHELRLY
jgi:hypothetical protein